MILDFEKWHGAKNDFIVLWMNPSDIELESLRAAASRLCARDGAGIGADGLLILRPQAAREKLLPDMLTIINSDGSMAATCGNGIRVASLSVLRRFWNATFRVDIPDAFELPLAAGGSVMVRYLGHQSLTQTSRHWPYVSVAMGRPLVDASRDPQHFAAVQAEVARISSEIGLSKPLGRWNYVHIGNEHLVFQLEQADRDLLLRVGPAFQQSKLWDGINVHLAVAKSVEPKDNQRASREIAANID